MIRENLGNAEGARNTGIATGILRLKSLLIPVAAFFIGMIVATLVTTSLQIGIPFGFVCSGIPIVASKVKLEKRISQLEGLWPEILDSLISGLQSGLSLPETIAALSTRGPVQARSTFALFEFELTNTGNFSRALRLIKDEFNQSTADQVCEVLELARSAGSRDTANTLRTLSNFIRSDMALRSEIAAKHGWVRNSAALAAIAPWILLLLLASQPNTVTAYSSSSGVTVLLIGVILTFVAYGWMARVGRIKQVPRVFE